MPAKKPEKQTNQIIIKSKSFFLSNEREKKEHCFLISHRHRPDGTTEEHATGESVANPHNSRPTEQRADNDEDGYGHESKRTGTKTGRRKWKFHKRSQISIWFCLLFRSDELIYFAFRNGDECQHANENHRPNVRATQSNNHNVNSLKSFIPNASICNVNSNQCRFEANTSKFIMFI